MEGKRWQRRSKFRGCLYSDSETWKYIGGSYRSPNFKSRGFNYNTSAPSSGPSCYVWWRNFLLVSWLRSSTKDVEQIVCRRLFYHRCCRFIILLYVVITACIHPTRRPLLAHMYPCWNASNRTGTRNAKSCRDGHHNHQATRCYWQVHRSKGGSNCLDIGL